MIHGGDIYSYCERYKKSPIDFSSNINPLGMPNGVKDFLFDNFKLLEIYPDLLNRKLKNAVAKNEGIKEEYIFCANGVSEALFVLAAALKPKKALIAVPTFSEYEISLKRFDTEIVFYNTRKEFNFEIREDFIDYIDHKTDIVYLCNPNNPTGTVIKNDLLEKIIHKTDEVGGFAAVDESFIDFCEKSDTLSAKGLLNRFSRLIILKSYTKIYAMAGLRAGFIFTSNKMLLNRLENEAPAWNVSSAASLCVRKAAEDGKYKDETVSFVKKERLRLLKALQSVGLKTYDLSNVNFILFECFERLNLPSAFERYGILIRSCENFRGLYKNFYRIAVRTEEENSLFIKRLKTIFEEEKSYGKSDNDTRGGV